MICKRCCGLMIQEELPDGGGEKGNDRPSAFRCICCGDIIDPVILTNRTRCGEAGMRRRRAARCHINRALLV